MCDFIVFYSYITIFTQQRRQKWNNTVVAKKQNNLNNNKQTNTRCGPRNTHHRIAQIAPSVPRTEAQRKAGHNERLSGSTANPETSIKYSVTGRVEDTKTIASSCDQISRDATQCIQLLGITRARSKAISTNSLPRTGESNSPQKRS